MNADILSWVLNLVLGGFMWLLKNAHDDLKEQIKENREDIKKVQETALKKEDFNEFKKELWGRLDRFEDSVNAKLL
jgi:hypothetical protein